MKPLQPMNKFSYVLGTADICLAVLEEDAGSFSVPSKVLSYFCAGKPILMHGPAKNLSSKLIIDNECGLVSSGNNFDKLESNLIKIRNKGNIDKMARNSRNYAINNFQIEEVTKIFLGETFNIHSINYSTNFMCCTRCYGSRIKHNMEWRNYLF